MENKVLKLGGGRSTQDVYAEIRQGNSERWTIQSREISTCCLGPALIRMVMLFPLITIYPITNTLQ